VIEADKIETIAIKYLPGSPKKFTKKLYLQVSHFAPEEIVITGEASFADIMLDLPRFENDSYRLIRKEAKANIKYKEEESKKDRKSIIYQVSL
jgi:hypothetical protein